MVKKRNNTLLYSGPWLLRVILGREEKKPQSYVFSSCFLVDLTARSRDGSICRVVLYHPQYSTILYYTVLYCTIHHTVQHLSSVLYSTVLYRCASIFHAVLSTVLATLLYNAMLYSRDTAVFSKLHSVQYCPPYCPVLYSTNEAQLSKLYMDR